ncbi:acetyltransferase (GNAT) family protein [Pontibacter ummariensis]|uniref:Acetyltransferase (GNAT) domain-containing protein n=1 Tax=Pontibacter ummariensis TaxID=1610492 RepID=A0A239FQ89_9BACT|nr:GNAT family N-acetyltransferase [Pontibacter ummariensis]PRY11973.1 acetyltransferase (GNAT) family protein [Pontibacter ummariensis]SNS58955.1 Acetyltransferase (GNAT) domain-containing protein [Pontibacter ummariensis]
MEIQFTSILPEAATPADADLLCYLGSTTFAQTFGYLFDAPTLAQYLAKTFKSAKLRRSLQNPENKYWIAYAEGKAMGYAKLKLGSESSYSKASGQVQLQKIYLLKEYLHKGFGQQLLDLRLREAESKGSDLMWLHVFQENEPAAQFYLRNSFRVLGPASFTIGQQALQYYAMGRDLHPRG